MRKAINKQTMLGLAEMVKLLSQFQRWLVLCTHSLMYLFHIRNGFCLLCYSS